MSLRLNKVNAQRVSPIRNELQRSARTASGLSSFYSGETQLEAQINRRHLLTYFDYNIIDY